MGNVSGPEYHTHDPPLDTHTSLTQTSGGSGTIDSARASPLWHHVHRVGPVKPLRKPLRACRAPDYDVVALAEREWEEMGPELGRRRLNWRGLAHDAFYAGERIYHDIKGKREDELVRVARSANWHGMAHDIPKAFPRSNAQSSLRCHVNVCYQAKDKPASAVAKSRFSIIITSLEVSY
ncbi:hypothetical protein DAEQUDRAFT_741525 [Daedalea quercina L-15889]|uniref:Uncharacterized protein n=1 Tax=Daedalea quercina L-15889 TaxID=1314783 RepID=A0A165L997_9APHY|nr:hypothetical protein DAEQUDRAFT_741525 [Daedalea quercina L-15889]